MPELIWDGKYRELGGQRVRVEPGRVALPLRVVERAGAGEPVACREAPDSGWVNRLIRGDKRWVLPSLLPEFGGRVGLIYIDPPFDTGADFSSRTRVPGRARRGEGAGPAVVEQRAYRDRWGLDAYLQWFSETVVLLRELLTERGSLYVHLDWRAAHHARLILDEVFGADCFRAEIVWRYRRWPVPTPNVQRMHDTLLYYARSPRVAPTFHTLYEPLAASTQQTFGSRRQVADFSSGRRKPSQLDQESPGAPLSDVWDIGVIAPSGHERVGYPTQKPEALLERVLRLSSSEGDLVLDCFSGSGTTAVVAEKLGRRWIAADVGRLAVHAARRRLLGLPSLRPMVVQDLGPHERQAWLGARFASVRTARAREEAGRAWLLERFGARAVADGGHLHGQKGERWVHVGATGGEVSLADVRAIVAAARAASGARARPAVDVLGWSFAADALASGLDLAARSRVALTLRRIPREVLDERSHEPGRIGPDDFDEPASLSARLRARGRTVRLELTGFALPSSAVSDEVRSAVDHWSQWIDSWAVDWDWQGATLHPTWHALRARRSPDLALAASHTYERAGSYRIALRVTDLLGHDTVQVVRRRVR